MDAPRQKLMKERATVVATTTLAVVVVGLLTSSDIYWDISQALFYLAAQVLAYDGSCGAYPSHSNRVRTSRAWIPGVAGGRMRSRSLAWTRTERLRHLYRSYSRAARSNLSPGSTGRRAVRRDSGGRRGGRDIPQRSFLR